MPIARLPLISLLLALFAAAQQQPPETSARPMTAREKKKQEDRLRKELKSPYDGWVTKDVPYIITDEERTVFGRLANDEEREQFIEQFWLRRDPTPDTVENEFKEEHYRRIAYANEHFASGIPGWKTDRGRIYITFGPPDERDEHASGGFYQRPPEEGGGTTSTYPFEKWRYRHIDDVGDDIEIEFVDPSGSGEFHMTRDPNEKDALLHVPNAGLTDAEASGTSTKADRLNGNIPGAAYSEKMNPFTRLSVEKGLLSPPRIKFGDLAVVSSGIEYSLLPMKVRIAYFPLTEASVLTSITVQFDNADLQFRYKDSVQRATINLLGRVGTLTRRTVIPFEATVTVDSPPQMLQAIARLKSVYNTILPLSPGTYRLNLAAKDIVGGNQGRFEMALEVPRLDAEKLQTSTLILADVLEKVPPRHIGAGPFVIGDDKVRPRVDAVFDRGERLGVYTKAYNFGANPAGRAPSGQVEYEITKTGANEKVYDFVENLSQIPGAASSQVTIEKLFDLKDLAPGQYTLRLNITDRLRGQSVIQSADFTVR